MIRNQAIRSKNQTSEKCISDHKSMLFFFQHHEEKSTFHDYYMDMITANFGDDLDHLRKVNDNIIFNCCSYSSYYYYHYSYH